MVQPVDEYLSIEALKIALRDARPDPNPFDDAYRLAIRAASRQIDQHCDTQFWRADPATAKQFQAEDARTLWTGPISDTTGLVVKFDQDNDGVFETTLLASDWQAGPVNRSPGRPYDRIDLVSSVRFPGAWRNNAPWYGYPAAGGYGGYSGYLYGNDARFRPLRARVEVTAHWGWPELPWQVVQACQILAMDHFKSKDMTGSSAGTPMTSAGSFGAQAAYQVKGGGMSAAASGLLCGLRDYVIA